MYWRKTVGEELTKKQKTGKRKRGRQRGISKPCHRERGVFLYLGASANEGGGGRQLGRMPLRGRKNLVVWERQKC